MVKLMMMENNFKKKILLLGGLCVLFAFLILLLTNLQKTQVVQHRAAGTGQIKFTLVPRDNNTVVVNSDKIIDIFLKNTGAAQATIFSLETEIQFNTGHVSVAADSVGCVGMNTQINSVTGNKVYLVCAKTQGFNLASNTLVKVGSFTVHALGTPVAQSPLHFSVTTIPDGAGGDLSDAGTDLNLVIAAAAGGATSTPTLTPMATPTHMPAGKVSVYAVPSWRRPASSPVQGKAGVEFTEDIYLNAGSNTKYVKIVFGYSSSKVDFKSVSFGDSGFAGDITKVSGKAVLEATNTNGKIGHFKLAIITMRVAADRPEPSPATYIFACRGEANGEVCNINGVGSSGTSYEVVVGKVDGDKIIRIDFTPYGTIQPTATTTPPGGVTGTPTPTTTPDPSQTATVNFKVKFQGISQKRADQKVEVRVTKGTFEEEFTNINMIANDSGVYSGSVVLTGVTVGGDYTIFVKGPKHLAKKFCVDAQESRCRGAGDLTLVAGANTFDFSKMALEGGDLPNPNSSGAQDGVCNSVDYSLAKNRLGSSSSADLAIADINLDGIVNAIDLTLIRNTLEVKYEEDF